jgi:diacylglycerol kinase family enzyme
MDFQQPTRLARYRLTLDDTETVEVEALTCLALFSGNLGIPALPGSLGCPEDDHIDVIALQKADLATFANLMAMVTGGSPNPQVFQHWHVREARIESDPPEIVQFDGEVLGETPSTVRVVPQGVQILVPGAAR